MRISVQTIKVATRCIETLAAGHIDGVVHFTFFNSDSERDR
jgi:hypothetical protein